MAAELLRDDPDLTVRAACRASGVSASAFHRYRNREATRIKKKQRRLRVQTLCKEVFKKYNRTYGVPRVFDDLANKQNIEVSRFEVECAFKSLGLVAKAAQKRAARKGRQPLPKMQQCTDLLKRNFSADAPNQKLVSDVTCLKFAGGKRKAYACFVKDLFGRTAVGWSLSKHHDSALVLAGLQKAFGRDDCDPSTIDFMHSDQGSEYTSQEVHDFLSAHGIEQSFSAKGKCHDNASAESFNNTFKTECEYAKANSLEELRTIVARYVDDFYNPVRSHSYNKQRAPEVVRHEALRV